ncbi:MAG: 5'/3'-nucleotidase SurE, partial [Acidimicrobiales bacterium]
VSASGTVGAALEAAMVGVPAVAFSAVRSGDWETWSRHMGSPESRPEWTRLAGVATDIAAEVWANGLPEGTDVLSVNIPSDADRDTPRRMTRLADSRHGTLFEERDGRYEHRGSAGLRPTEPNASDTDMAASDAGVVSITPLRMAQLGQTIDPALRTRFET